MIGMSSTEAGVSRPNAVKSIVYGGLAVGILDGLAATVNAGVRGISPVRVFQYISSALFGSAAFEGGTTMMLLGILLHFGVGFGVAIAFYLLVRAFPSLLSQPLVTGTLYGIVVYFAMAYAFVPLTLVRQGLFSWNGFITGIIIHILFVGLPVALIAKRYERGIVPFSAR